MIGYSEKRSGTPVVPLTPDTFEQAIDNKMVAELCGGIATALDKVKSGEMSREEFTQYKDERKAMLPVLTPHALFKNDQRKNSGDCEGNAVPTGWVMADFDHLEENPWQVYDVCIKPLIDRCGIVLAHVSAGREGLHIIFRQPQGMSIKQAQLWMGEETGLQVDTTCADLSRCSYVVPRAYILYTADGLFGENPATEVPKEELVPWSYKGIPAEKIVGEWIRENGGPVEGSSCDMAYKLARDLRTVCDNDAGKVMAAIPSFGLPEEKVRAAVESALKARYMPSRRMQKIVTRLTGTQAEEDDSWMEKLIDAETLPPALRKTLAPLPKKLYWPVTASLLPLMGALADMVSAEYCTGEEFYLGLMTIVVGEQGAGKSKCADAIKLWNVFKEDDVIAYGIEEEYARKLKYRKANEDLPPEPQVVVRDVPVDLSLGKLAYRLRNAQGHCLFSFSDELDDLVGSNKAGAWANKNSVYRHAFNREEWGQDFKAEGVHGKWPVAYNWTMLGTYGSLAKCFAKDNVENGLSGRIILAQMPRTRYQLMPHYERYNPEDIAFIKREAERLRTLNGLVDTPRLREAIRKWNDDLCADAEAEDDPVKDIYRKRAAVIGFRAGVICHLLWGDEEERDATLQFATTVADLTFAGQMNLFGEKLREELEEQQIPHFNPRNNKEVFRRLPDEFTVDELKILKKGTCNDASLNAIIERLAKDGKIIEVGKTPGKNGKKKWKKTGK